MEQTGLERFKHKVAKWIPTHISPKTIVLIYGLFDRLSFIGRSVRNKHRAYNETVLSGEDSPLTNGYIDNQSQWKDVLFGKRDMAYSGCEIMAVYNALYALGKGSGYKLIAELIEEFEKSGAAMGGIIGSSPTSIKRHLKKHGIKSRIVWQEDKLDPDTDLAIVTVYNDKNTLYSQIHTITFTRDENGFSAHNAYSRQKYYTTLKDAIGGVGTDPKMICAIEIDKKSL